MSGVSKNMLYSLSGHQNGQPQYRKRQALGDSERPQKRVKGLLDEDCSSEHDQSTSGSAGGVRISERKASPAEDGFKINENFARRFDHNKKREELQRLEEKYGSDDPSTDSEEEDDDGILASGVLDAQITDTLEAIRRKDPRVYDEKVRFYTDLEEDAHDHGNGLVKKEKPMYLSDYHRRNLLEGQTTSDEAEDVEDAPVSYVQQQTDLKSAIVKEMHAAANGDAGSDDGRPDDVDSDDGFLIRKPPQLEEKPRSKSMKPRQQEIDVESADKDPETYLSNFVSARAWVPSESSRFQPFESDDEEEERQADAFEEAYNLRFEDPKTSNEKLLSHARDAAAKYSVRKEETNPRKKAREAERAKKDSARRIREEEKARMRKLKVAQAEEKINKIKEAAGLRGESLREEDWAALLEEGWDDVKWEQEMQKRFGNEYYADHDAMADDVREGESRKLKKPKWEDDIDIGDLISDFDAADAEKPLFSLTEDESDAGGAPIMNSVQNDSEEDPKTTRKTSNKQGKEEQKISARKERQKIERFIDQQMDVDEKLSSFGKKHSGHFRYRETSPTAYGLTAHDILMASDSQLNQYAGLKKMAAFRDPGKKRKDKKQLSKKARLRQWRKDTFGNEQGPQETLAEVRIGENALGKHFTAREKPKIDIEEGKKKRKRSKKSKAPSNPV